GFDTAEGIGGEALGLEAGRVDVRAALERTGAAAGADNVFDLPRRVAEPSQGRGERGVDDLEVAAAGELLELDEGKIGLDARGVAVHDQADRACRRYYGDLRISISIFL